jgi:hypothetical protein
MSPPLSGQSSRRSSISSNVSELSIQGDPNQNLRRILSSTSLAGKSTHPVALRPTAEQRLIIGLIGLATLQRSYKQSDKHLFSLYELEEDFRYALSFVVLDKSWPSFAVKYYRDIISYPALDKLEARLKIASQEANSKSATAPLESFKSSRLKGLLFAQNMRVIRAIVQTYDHLDDDHQEIVRKETCGRDKNCELLCSAVIKQHKEIAYIARDAFEQERRDNFEKDNDPKFFEMYRKVQDHEKKSIEHGRSIIDKIHRADTSYTGTNDECKACQVVKGQASGRTSGR